MMSVFLLTIMTTCYVVSHGVTADVPPPMNRLLKSHRLIQTMVLRAVKDLAIEKDRRISLEKELSQEREKRKLLEASQLQVQDSLAQEAEERRQLEARLEDKMANLKGALEHRMAMFQEAVENATSKMILHGSWSTWGSWGDCTMTCSDGQRMRIRTCTYPAPINGGRECVGRDHDTTRCNNTICPPVHGSWSSWDSWGDCTKTCGNGQRNRTRTCTNPAPNYDGQECVGREHDIDSCNIMTCPPVHGSWSSWDAWGDCTKTCGNGLRNRTRTCTNPAPNYDGQECVGREHDIDSCNNMTCPPVLQQARLILGGLQGKTAALFDGPKGVDVSHDGNRFYVADSWNNRVKIYSVEGVFIGTFGSSGKGDGQFSFPTGLAVNSYEEVFVADSNNCRIEVFGQDGQFKFTFGTCGSNKGQFTYPWGVAVDGSDNVYVCDSNNHRVQVFTRTGEFIRQYGQKGSAPGQLNKPRYLAVAAITGRVYVSDASNHRVSVFSTEGEFMFTFGTEGTADGQMKSPAGIAIDDQGFVFVVDRDNHVIQMFYPDGTFVSTFGSRGSKNGQLYYPRGLAITRSGDVIVSDDINHRVQILTTAD